MTKEELIANGWEPKDCRIGTLYFKDNYFCRLNEDTGIITLSSCHDDMNHIGQASTFDELKELQRNYELNQIKITELILKAMKRRHENIYNEKVEDKKYFYAAVIDAYEYGNVSYERYKNFVDYAIHCCWEDCIDDELKHYLEGEEKKEIDWEDFFDEYYGYSTYYVALDEDGNDLEDLEDNNVTLNNYIKEHNLREEKIVIPTTIEEAINNLDKILSKEDKEYIFKEGALSVHDSLGRWIRNNWKLWFKDGEENELKKALIKKGFSHPDDMSNYIIEEYIKYFKNK